MKLAWIENDYIRDICVSDPYEVFHQDIACKYDVQVSDDAESGDMFVDGVLTKPTVTLPEPVKVESKRVSPVEFKLLFTGSERIAIKSARATDLAIDDFYDIIEDPRLTYVDLGLSSTRDALNYMQSTGLLTQDRVTEILDGVIK